MKAEDQLWITKSANMYYVFNEFPGFLFNKNACGKVVVMQA